MAEATPEDLATFFGQQPVQAFAPAVAEPAPVPQRVEVPASQGNAHTSATWSANGPPASIAGYLDAPMGHQLTTPVPNPGAAPTAPPMVANYLAAKAATQPKRGPSPEDIAAAIRAASARPSGGGMGGGPYPGAGKEFLGAHYDRQMALERRETAVNTERDTAIAAAHEEAANANVQRIDRAKAQQAEQGAHIEREVMKQKALAEEARGGDYDPSAFFRNPGGIMMAIGAALGGGSAARVTGRNEGQAALNSALERDFNSWKANADKKQNAVANQNNIVSLYRAAYADKTEADLRARVEYGQAAIDKIKAVTVKAGIPSLAVAGEQAIEVIKGDQLRSQEAANARAAAAYGSALRAQEAARQKAADDARADRKLDIEEGKVRSEAGNRVAAETAGLADKLQSTGVTEALAALDLVKKRQQAAPGAFSWVKNELYDDSPWMHERLTSAEDASAQNAADNFEGIMNHKWSGSAQSQAEIKSNLIKLRSSRTQEGRNAALNNIGEVLLAEKAGIEAGRSSEAVKLVQGRTAATKRPAEPKPMGEK